MADKNTWKNVIAVSQIVIALAVMYALMALSWALSR